MQDKLFDYARLTPRAMLGFGVIVAALCGCRNSESKLPQRVLRCAQLQGAKQSSLDQLAQKVREIEASGYGPAQLTLPLGQDQTNAAAALAKVFTDADRLRVLPRLVELVRPAGGFYPPSQVGQLKDLLWDERELLQAAQQAAELPRCVSGARFDLGYFDRYSFLDDASLAMRLQLAAAIVAFEKGDRPTGLRQAIAAAKWIQWLATEQRLEARLLAAQLRAEWLELLRNVAGWSVSTAELSAFFSSLRNQLNDWPADRDAFLGDRALGLHAYEAVRLGMIERVLTREEKRQLQQTQWLAKIKALDGPSIDRDELIYLQAMQQILDACNKPYYQRTEGLSALFDRVLLDGHDARLAPLASRLFLTGMPEALEQMARDRALCEAWLLAIASAARFDLPPYRTSPLSGRAYQAERRADGVLLKLGDPQSADPYVRSPSDLSGS